MKEERNAFEEFGIVRLHWEDWEEMKGFLHIMLQEPERAMYEDVEGLRETLAGTGLMKRCVLMPWTEDGPAGVVRVEKEMLAAWGKTPQEVFRKAEENLREKRCPVCMRLTEMVSLMSPAGRSEDDLPENPILVLTNEEKFLGASMIACPGVLQELLKDSGIPLFYVIPSSLHEVLLVPGDDFGSPEGLTHLLQDVNRMEVPEDEILSDRLLAYSVPEDRLFAVET